MNNQLQSQSNCSLIFTCSKNTLNSSLNNTNIKLYSHNDPQITDWGQRKMVLCLRIAASRITFIQMTLFRSVCNSRLQRALGSRSGEKTSLLASTSCLWIILLQYRFSGDDQIQSLQYGSMRILLFKEKESVGFKEA